MANIATENNKLNVLFQSPVSAVAPGQSAVFYENDDLVGGGIIERQLVK
jgi:tRNA-specific 2-thiouridylase